MRYATLGLMMVFAGLSATAYAKDAPMEPGLWSMDIQGTTRVDPNLSVPMQRDVKICVKPGQKPESVVVPMDGKQCTREQATLAGGETQWTFHCDLPQAKVTQTGTFRTGPATFESKWSITSVAPSGAITQSDMQVNGKRLGSDCGNVK